MGTIDFQYKSNTIEINGTIQRMKYPILKILEFDQLLIVLLEIPCNVVYNRNVFAIGSNGVLKWQVESPPMPTKTDSPFTNISSDLDNNKLFAYNWNGGLYEIDILNGTILSSKLMK